MFYKLMARFVILCLIFIDFQSPVKTFGITGDLKVIKDVIFIMDKVWTIVDQDVDLTQYGDDTLLRRQVNEVFKKIKKIDSKMKEIYVKPDTIQTLNKNIMEIIISDISVKQWLNNLVDNVTQIDGNYQKMLEYTNEKSYNRKALENFGSSVISLEANSVANLLEMIYTFVLPQGTMSENDLFGKLAWTIKAAKNDFSCKTRYSPQQLLYKLYDIVALIELKGYIMVQVSYALLRLYAKGSFTNEVKQTRTKYEKRTNHTVKAAGDLLQYISRELWRCDPTEHKQGETYEELTNLIQGYITNEQNVDENESCLGSCSDYTYMKMGSRPGGCHGNLMECQSLPMDYIEVCTAPKISHRRYQYIQFKNGPTWGRKGKCQKTTTLNHWNYYWFWKCNYCLCFCDEEGLTSDRYFNMKSVMSDIKNNKVVTGLRFVKTNGIIHLQIQEAGMLPMLKINSTTLRWKPVNDYKLTDRKIYQRQDVHTFTWIKNKLDLDDLECDDGYVVTGVRFKEMGTRLNFEIYTTKFDFESGRLQPEYSKWIDYSRTGRINERTELRLTRPKVPTQSYFPSIPTSRPNQYIKFTHSDIDSDLAQTTVPFLDAQEVESLEPVPLAGAGLFHKGRPSFGGFITPKIITYDVSKHLEQTFSLDKED